MNDTPGDLMKLYENTYEGFDREQFLQLMDEFALPAGRRISSFSKGMKKQLLVALGVCAGTKYILCDETFDGLDPLMRKRVKDIFARYMESRGLTPVIASHSLRELEDICDHVGLLHQGGILLSGDLRDMKLSVHKIQFVTRSEESFEGLDVVTCSHKGSIYTLTVRGEKEEILKKLRAMDSIFYELIPLSLEEIFISETEVKGYDVSKIL
jgi:ABC-2 type transport system ATP-binding protein